MLDGEGVAYVDSSALLKLVVARGRKPSAPSGALRVLAPHLERPRRCSGHAVARAHSAAAVEQAEEILEATALRPIDQEIVHRAACLATEPGLTRRHHLATALALEPPIGRFFCYDARLNAAARASDLPVEAPA